MTCVRRRPRRRGARTRTDLPQREQRSRLRALLEAAVGARARRHLGHRRRHRANQRRHRDWFVSICRRRGSLRRRHAARGASARARAAGLRAGVPQHVLGPRRRRRRGLDARPAPTARGCARAASRGAPRRPRTSSARSRCARRCARCAWPTTTTPRRRRRWPSSTRSRAPSAPAAALDAEPAHRRARARGRRARRGVRPGPGDRLRRARRRHLHAAEGVPARALRLGLLRLLAQPLGPVVLDAHLRQPHQGRDLPPAPRAPR